MAKLVLVIAGLLVGCCSASSQLTYHDVRGGKEGVGYSVTYDDRSFIIGGQRTLLLSGAVHYPRVHEGEWETVFKEMIMDGLNTVQTYLYWNLHQNEMGGQYNFTGNKNWTRFVELAGEAGLFVVLRIGPFVASEWDYGAIPHWVTEIPGMYVRSSNKQWEAVMQKVFTDMVEIARPLTAPHGGPIILAQIENEYRWSDPDYIDWCGSLVKDVELEIPFLMCNGYSANNTINANNGNDGTAYAEKHSQDFPGQPLAWTEDEGWYQSWDKQPLTGRDNRSPQDMASVIMKWFARGGGHHNYYMWYGGNNFGRMAGACVTTMYADGVNLHSDMLPNEPKRTHLSKLMAFLASYSFSLLYSPSQVHNSIEVGVFNATINAFVFTGEQWAYVYDAIGRGVAFIENSVNKTVLVEFRGMNFSMPGLSSTMVDLEYNGEVSSREIFNSAKVNSEGLPTERVYYLVYEGFAWKVWQEDVQHLELAWTGNHPYEQLGVTGDASDYLFYQTTVFGPYTGNVNLTVQSRFSNSFLIFIDGRLEGIVGYCVHNQGNITYHMTVFTEEGIEHQLTLLSVSLGVNTHTNPGEFDKKGIVGNVTFGGKDITHRFSGWFHRPKLAGEIMKVYTVEGSSNVTWSVNYWDYIGEPVVWFQHTFPSPTVESGYSLLLDMMGMQRGYIYLNGVNLGRYWLTQVNGEYVQRYYYIPRTLLRTSGDNFLVLVEEIGALDPESVKLVESTLVIPKD